MKKDILRVFSTNLIKMLVTFVTAFIVPMVLSVEQYGYLKLYQFYVSYLGISHMGFCDGIYLEYGGQDVVTIDKKRVAIEQKTLLLYECFIMVLFLVVGFCKKDFVTLMLGFTVVPSVMMTFYTYLFQSTGIFKIYTRVVNVSTITNLVVNLLLVFFSIQDYKIYVLLYCFVQYVSCFVGYLAFEKNGWNDFKVKASFNILLDYIKSGVVLMIGNFVYTIFLGIDKWFIKFTLDISQFSMYSFATQMMTLINMVITPIAMTLYSNMRSKMDKLFEIKVKRILIGILMLMPTCMYIVKYIIENYIDKYKEVVPVMAVLVVMQMILSLNTAIFVNLYKVYKKQSSYFIRLIIAVGIAIILDGLVSIINPSIIGYAIVSVVSCVIWLLENLSCFKYMKLKGDEVFFILVLMGEFIFGFLFVENVIVQLSLYMFVYIFLLRFLMKDVYDFGKNILVDIVYKAFRG